MLHGGTKRDEGTRTTPSAAIGQRRGADQSQQTLYWSVGPLPLGPVV